MRIKLDPTGDLSILKIRRTDLGEVLTAAALNCYDGIKKNEADKDTEGVAYHKGLLAFIQGLEQMVKDQMRPEPVEPPLASIPKAVRREAVEEVKRERLFIDNLVTEALAEVKARKAKKMRSNPKSKDARARN